MFVKININYDFGYAIKPTQSTPACRQAGNAKIKLILVFTWKQTYSP